jgi:ribonuclease Z
MRDTLEGFSRALYSNWLWHRRLRLIVDAGEGLALALGTNVYAPSIVALSHGHSDHVLGLPGLAGARRFGKGATEKAWTVVYPAGSSGVEAARQLIADMWRGVSFPIGWVAIASGQRHPLDSTRTLEAFAVTHVPAEPAMGYRVVEARRRLKAEFASLPTTEIERLSKSHGRDGLMERFEHVVFAHSGDAMPIDPALVQGADLLVHDATFLGTDERRAPIHATTGEALDVAREARVGTLVLNHLSIRYDRVMALATLRDQVVSSGFAGACWLLDEGTFHNLRPV